MTQSEHKPRARIMVATPTYDGSVCSDFCVSLNATTLYCAVNNVEIELNIADRYTLIQFARNRLLQDFLDDPSYTHILWIDSDLGFDATATMRLLEHDVDVVGGAYPVKAFPPWFPIQPIDEHPDPKTGLLRVITAPTGFLLCSRRAMEAVAKDAPLYTHYHQGQEIVTKHVFDLKLVPNMRGEKDKPDDLIGEDVVLCRLLHEQGFEVFIEPDINFGHHGNNRWAGNLKVTLDKKATDTPEQKKLQTAIAAALDMKTGPGAGETGALVPGRSAA